MMTMSFRFPRKFLFRIVLSCYHVWMTNSKLAVFIICQNECLVPQMYFAVYVSKEREVLIHKADPQSWPEVITIFARVVCTSVLPYILPTYRNRTEQNTFQVKIVIATGGTVGLAWWIIDCTLVL